MDISGINAFVRQYADDTLRYLLMRLGDRQEAEDAFVEVFKAAAESGDLTWECIKENADNMSSRCRGRLAVSR